MPDALKAGPIIVMHIDAIQEQDVKVGSVCTVDGDRVGALDATVKSMGDALRRLGKGSAELLRQGGQTNPD